MFLFWPLKLCLCVIFGIKSVLLLFLNFAEQRTKALLLCRAKYDKALWFCGAKSALLYDFAEQSFFFIFFFFFAEHRHKFKAKIQLQLRFCALPEKKCLVNQCYFRDLEHNGDYFSRKNISWGGTHKSREDQVFRLKSYKKCILLWSHPQTIKMKNIFQDTSMLSGYLARKKFRIDS